MARFCFQHGRYDTQSCMPIEVQYSYPYHTSPFPLYSYSTWINTTQLHGEPPPTSTPQTRKTHPTSSPSPPTPSPETTAPIKRPLRSILKRTLPVPVASQASKRKSVRFTTSTASPSLAAPGTYKHAGRPKPRKARHPARSHPCLISTLPQQAQEAMAAVSGPPPVSKHVSNTSLPIRVQPCAAGDAARPRPRPRPLTPPPAAFFRGPDHVHAQSAGRPLPHQSNRSAPQQPVPASAVKSQVLTLIRTGLKKRIHIQTQTQIPKPAYSISYAKPYSSDSEESNTDVRLATKLSAKKPRQTQMEAKAAAMTKKEEATATTRGLKALAREFDRKNAWRRGEE